MLASLEEATASAATIEASLEESGTLQEALEQERKAYLTLSQVRLELGLEYFLKLDYIIDPFHANPCSHKI